MKQQFSWLQRFIFLILSIVVFCNTLIHANKPPVLSINKDFTSSKLKGYLWRADQLPSSTTADHFLQKFKQGQQGRLLTDEVPNLGDDGLPQWIGFRIRNKTFNQLTLIFELDFIAPEEISFYAWDSDQLVKKIEKVSWRTPPNQRDVSNRVQTFRLIMQPDVVYYCAIRVQQRVGFLVFPIKAYEEHEFDSHSTFVNMAHGLTFGFLLLAMLVGIAFWLLAGEGVYGYYAIYVLGIAGFELEEQGYLNQYLVGYFDVLASQAAWPIFSQVAIIGHTLFVIHFLRLNELNKYRVWILPGQILIGFSTVLLLWLLFGLPFNDYVYSLALIFAFIYTLISFIYLVLAAYYRHKESYLYILAVSPLFLSFVYIVIATIDLLPESWLLFTFISYAPAWEVCILFIGLARRFNIVQRQRILALEKAAELQLGLVQAMDEAQESERRRIAQDLHDDVGNTLATAKASISLVCRDHFIQATFPELIKISSLIEKAGQDLRSISHNLMPIEFEKYALTSVVKQAVERVAATPIHFEYIQVGHEKHFTPEYSLIIYRIINELINNIINHSNAQIAVVQMLFQPEYLVVSVEDDGEGFQNKETDHSTGIGLKNISSRVNYIGANLDVSWNQSGTCVTVEIPYARNSSHARYTSLDNR